jgi:hypothetical protein
MASTYPASGPRRLRRQTTPETPRLGRLLTILACFDIGIWSYVAIAANPPATPPAGQVVVAMKAGQI